MQADFIPIAQLAQLTGRAVKTIQNERSTGRGPLTPILTKVGGRLGAWREDYETWRASQRKLSDAA